MWPLEIAMTMQKKFSFQLINKKWKLSPAYDLLPSNGFNGFHTTMVNNSGAPAANDMMMVAEKVGLNMQRANELLQSVVAKAMRAV